MSSMLARSSMAQARASIILQPPFSMDTALSLALLLVRNPAVASISLPASRLMLRTWIFSLMLNKDRPDGAAVGEDLDLVVGDGLHECHLTCSRILEGEGTAVVLVGVVLLVLLHIWLHHLLLDELTVERATVGLFGCPAYGIFVVRHVADKSLGALSHMWAGRRSRTKPTWTGLLDCLATGDMATGKMPLKAARKEAAKRLVSPPCLPRAYTRRAVSATPPALRCNVLYTFDLRCPLDFAPCCANCMVASFECLLVAKLVRLVWHHADKVRLQSCSFTS
jgi:hypothetical protein